MSPEQNEQWQRAIKPLAERLTGERWEAEKALIALLPRLEQLRRVFDLCEISNSDDRSGPIPVCFVRKALLSIGIEQLSYPWFPRFALRSACALLGIQLAHPEAEARQALSQQIYVRFVRESLLPFIDWLEQMPPDDARKECYTSLVALYEVCKDFSDSMDPEKWRESFSCLGFDRDEWDESENGHCLEMVNLLAQSMLVELNLKYLLSDDNRVYCSPHTVPRVLHRQHQWRSDGKAGINFDDGTDYSHLIAEAFLTALEAECPPPDWLPRI